MLDDLTTALLESLDLTDRLNAALRFFVPSLADAASIALEGHPPDVRMLSKGREDTTSAPLTLPLAGGGGRIGFLQLHLNAAGAALPGETLAAFAARIGVAVHHSMSFERERCASLAFQHAALTTRLPRTPGYRLDAVYAAGRAEALIGGDWYDAFVLPDGRLIVSIGDVVGSGLRAAVAMVNVRQSLRTVAQIHPDPALMLEAANRTLIEEFPDRFVTTFVALIDPITRNCSYANAGHPPPFLRLPDGSVVQLPTDGIPLGVQGFSAHVRVGHMMLGQGGILVLYTDGVTEIDRRPLDGEAHLREAVALLHRSDETPAATLYARLLGNGARDDVAILTVTVEESVDVPRWRFDPRWPDVARRARVEMSERLAQEGLNDAQLLVFEIVYAEIVANLIHYAGGTAEFLLQCHSDSCVLHVLDKGPGYQYAPRLPNDLFSEGGRGLYLISRLADGFSVERRAGGGSHARMTFAKGKDR